VKAPALTAAFAIGAGVSLCELDRELALSLLMHGRTLVENTGSIGLTRAFAGISLVLSSSFRLIL
jgi:hypothetical protein